MHPYFQEVLDRVHNRTLARPPDIDELKYPSHAPGSPATWFIVFESRYWDAVLVYVAGDKSASQTLFQRAHARLEQGLRACEASAEAMADKSAMQSCYAVRAYWRAMELWLFRGLITKELFAEFHDKRLPYALSCKVEEPTRRGREFFLWKIALADLALKDFKRLSQAHREMFGEPPVLKSKSFAACRRDRYLLLLRLTQFASSGEPVPSGLRSAALEFANDCLLDWDDSIPDANSPAGVPTEYRPLFLWLILDALGMRETVDDLCVRMREQRFFQIPD